jgi:predicted  nucleic acid-binding Zn-ribbon protein
LEKLKVLQVVLNKKFQLEKKIVELPQEVELKEQIVFRMKENFLVADIQYQDLKKDVVLKNDELDRLQIHREQYEQEISQVSTRRDYEQIGLV